jgi:hypothetical protein
MTRLRFGVVAVLLAVMSCSDGDKSARELCQEATRAYCDKVFDCAEGEPKRTDEGGSKDACFTKNVQVCPQASACSASQTYHQDKAEQCAADYRALSCAAFGAMPNLAVCDEICTP